MLQRLRQARQRARLTQAEVARALGTTQGIVSKCETGERRLDPVELAMFAALYGVTIEQLVPPPSIAPARPDLHAEPARRVAERAVRPKAGARRGVKGGGGRSTKGQ